MTDPKNIYFTKIGGEVREASDWLRQNEVVGIPTETVYGLAGNALQDAAILKIFEAKNRPTFNPLILHVASISEFSLYANRIPEEVYKLAEHFSPGPITYLLPKNKLVPDLATSGLPNVALRIPAHPLLLNLLQSIDFPLAAPSANPFGYISPTNAQHVFQGLSRKIPYILDGGPCAIGVESTIISFLNDEPEILRLGGITPDDIHHCLGRAVMSHPETTFKPLAPGMLKSHYAPSIPLYSGDSESLKPFEGSDAAIISLDGKIELTGTHYILSAEADLKEAAANLFKTLRAADCPEKHSRILAVKVPSQGIGMAINDRLNRASVNS